jgi:hypothetical protein
MGTRSMSKTDKTKPYWVKVAEHDPVARHNHAGRACDLPPSPYDEPRHKWTGCYWDDVYLMHASCCRPGCSCRDCNGHTALEKRRRERYDGKNQIRAGEDYDTITRSGPGRPARQRKDTKHWCKGRYGRAHLPVVQWSNWASYWTARGRTCHGATRLFGTFRTSWSCYHQIACQRCGKILNYSVPQEDCPVWQAR